MVILRFMLVAMFIGLVHLSVHEMKSAVFYYFPLSPSLPLPLKFLFSPYLYLEHLELSFDPSLAINFEM